MGRLPSLSPEEKEERKKKRKAKYDKWKRDLPGNLKTYFWKRQHPFKSLDGFKFWLRIIVAILIAYVYYIWSNIREEYESKFLALCAMSDFQKPCGEVQPDEECLFKVEARLESQKT